MRDTKADNRGFWRAGKNHFFDKRKGKIEVEPAKDE